MRQKGAKILIGSIKLPFKIKAVRVTAQALLLAFIFWLASSSGAAEALERIARWAGGNDRIAGAAFIMELGTNLKENEGLIDAVLAVSVPYKAPTEPPELPAPPPSKSPVRTPRPTVKPTNSPALSHETIEMTGDTEDIDAAAIFSEPLNILLKGAPQILIIHTHSTESYSSNSGDIYTETDVTRTLNTDYNVVRVGEEIASALTKKGFSVMHDRGVYDFPSYTGSYSRSLTAIESYLKLYPSIKIVLDIHRDALMDAEGNIYRTSTQIGGKTSAQVMLVVGTGDGGANNPHWKENLKLAFHLQAAMNSKYEGLARPISISPERYNQHVGKGSLLVEVGCNGNTLDEALYAARLFTDAAAEVFEKLK